MISRSIPFECFRTKYTLNIPEAVVNLPIVNLRKFFAYTSQEQWRNEESTEAFFSSIPEIAEELKDKWDEASREFQRNYKDPKFDEHGNYITDKEARQRRRFHNKQLMADVKRAKTDYERFQRRIPKLEGIKATIKR